jgi:two-component system, LytTR family, sensor kinase
MKLKYLPYAVVASFTLIIAVVCVFLIPQWSAGVHLLIGIGQFIYLTLIWKFVEWLSSLLDRPLPFSKNVGLRMFVQILISLSVIIPVFVAVPWIERSDLPSFIRTQFMLAILVVAGIFTILINFISYFNYFFNQWERSVVRNAELQIEASRLEKETLRLQYHQLRNQVNPHFLFNTFSSLDGLVQADPDLASEFIRHVAKVYRYVLEHKENEVVSVETELNFMDNYILLLGIRYKNGISIRCDVSDEAKEKGIVIVTLQLLMDNAIKHNVVQERRPLNISIWNEGDYLFVENNKQTRRLMEHPNGHGLQQLRQLYTFLSDRPVEIYDKEDKFEIKLPLL